MQLRTMDCSVLGALALLLGSAPAIAAETARCFLTENHLSNPERTVPIRVGQDSIRETWCYENVSVGGREMQYVYNVDRGEVRPELAALVELDGNHHPIAVTHGSLDHGQTSFHRIVDADLNPISAPLTEIDARLAGKAVVREFDFNVLSSADSVLRALLGHSEEGVQITVAQGSFDSYLPKDRLPWRGYWWASQTLQGDSGSPLNLYDSIVKNWTGTDPHSRTWEAQNHDNSDLSWSGHCNGWAASALLYPEPRRRLWDPIGKRAIEPGQIKGMLAESSFCVQYAFYGNRYWGNPGDVLEDIPPALFHKVLVYYIDGLKKGVAHDYDRDEQVDNHIITGYHFDIKAGVRPGSFNVVAKLRVHKYDDDYDPELKGEPDSYTRTYSYTLDTSNGKILGGHWTGGDNPDFLWVPLAQANCGWENPNVDQAMIDRIQSEFKPMSVENVSTH